MSANLIQPSSYLRRVLWADAIVSATVGAVMVLGAGALQELLGLPSSLLLVAGLVLFPFVAYVGWLATRAEVARAAVWVPIALNVVWAADCLLLLLVEDLRPTLLGEAFIGLHIVTVLVFAEAEFIGLRRALSLPRAGNPHLA